MKRLLTDKELQKEISAVISSKNKKLITVGNAIYCEILPSGRSSFYLRIKDRIKDKRIPLGRYPENSLKCARKKAEEILKRHNEKMQVIKGTSKITFGEYSKKWVLTKKSNPELEHTHKNNKYFFNVKSALKKLKKLKNEYLSQITPSVVDEVLDDIKCAQYAKFHAIQILNQCLNCAVSEGLLLNNLCASMLKEGSIWLNKYGRPKIEGFAYVEPYKLKAEFYEKVESLKEKYKFFLLLLSFTMLRNGALAQSKWEWVDFDTRKIHVPAENMKMGRAFDVPITLFTEFLLKEWKAKCLNKGINSDFIFCSETDPQKPMYLSELQTNIADLTNRRATMHGLRKSARTWLSEMEVSELICELSLSHDFDSKLVKVYNKYDYFSERLAALRLWNYYLYSEQLPKSFTKLLTGLNQEILNRYRNDYLREKAKVDAIKNALY